MYDIVMCVVAIYRISHLVCSPTDCLASSTSQAKESYHISIVINVDMIVVEQDHQYHASTLHHLS